MVVTLAIAHLLIVQETMTFYFLVENMPPWRAMYFNTTCSQIVLMLIIRMISQPASPLRC